MRGLSGGSRPPENLQVQDVLVHKQVNAQVHQEQDRSDLQYPAIGVFLRRAGRVAAAVIMAICLARSQMNGPAQHQHQTGRGYDLDFIFMNMFVDNQQKTRHDGDQAQIGGKTEHRKYGGQDAAEYMAELGEQDSNRQMAVQTVHSLLFLWGQSECYSVAPAKGKIFIEKVP